MTNCDRFIYVSVERGSYTVGVEGDDDFIKSVNFKSEHFILKIIHQLYILQILIKNWMTVIKIKIDTPNQRLVLQVKT